MVSLGECLVEFTRGDSPQWHAGIAGDAVNTLVHAARRGRRCGLISRVGSDLFTSMILERLVRERIDTSCIHRVSDRNNGLYFIENDNAGEYTFHFWRSGSAATTTLQETDIASLVDYAASSEYFLLTGVTLAVITERKRLQEFVRDVAARGTRVAFDTNYRARLWESAASYRSAVEELLPHVSICLPSAADIQRAWPGHDPLAICSEWSTNASMTVALKEGAEGASLIRNGEVERHPAPTVNAVVDTTGAGDAFNAGFLDALLHGVPPGEAIAAAQRVARSVLLFRGALPP